MEIVANYFDAKEAAFAGEALRLANVPFTQEIVSSDTGDEYTLNVDSENFDKAALIIEKLSEPRFGSGAAKCPSCGAEGLTSTPHNGSFGEYTVYLCEHCQQSFVKRR